VYRATTAIDRIYNLIRELSDEGRTVRMADIVERCTSKGFTHDQINECIEEYEELNVWQVNQARTTVTFV